MFFLERGNIALFVWSPMREERGAVLIDAPPSSGWRAAGKECGGVMGVLGSLVGSCHCRCFFFEKGRIVLAWAHFSANI